ncbi:MAG: 3-dehydroquinate synthase [Flavobacteriales bacterium]|nr:3-dehydroquinate synthase [Flavobacteriales bacterium]
MRSVMAAGRPVVLGADALAALDAWLTGPGAEGRRAVVGDENTLRFCLPELLALVPALREAPCFAVPPGEASKSLGTCQALWGRLAQEGLGRDAVLVALGGGVVTDLAGFVGATYKRGIRVVNVPTSLMGMVDAAIGGKTAIDLDGVKNLVGLVRQPEGVYVHVPFLRTLGKRELLNGVAEMLKHGLVADADHWHALVAAPWHDLQALAPLVERSAALKCGVVSDDPEEHGSRRSLNFGHTIGHAVEAFSWEGPQRGLLHGEAVVAGMICTAWLSWRTGLLERGACDAITAFLLERFRRFDLQPADHHRIIALMGHDKKNRDGAFRFTLLEDIGRARIDVPLDAAQVAEALDHYRLLVRDAGDPHRRSA